MNSIAVIENFFVLVFKESYEKLLHEANVNDANIIQMGAIQLNLNHLQFYKLADEP